MSPQALRIEDPPGRRASRIEDPGAVHTFRIEDPPPPSKNPSILEKPIGFSRMTRFSVIGALDFGGIFSGNLGFCRNPNLPN